MTLVNKSSVPACLILDLLRNDYTVGVECLEVSLIENKKDKLIYKILRGQSNRREIILE